MDKRVKKEMFKELGNRGKFIAVMSSIVAGLTYANHLVMSAGWVRFGSSDAIVTDVSAAFMFACLEFLFLCLIFLFFETAYSTAKSRVREQDYQKEREQIYGSTAK